MQASVLDEILIRLNAMPAAEKKEIIKTAYEATKHLRWIPNPGPQTACVDNQADIIFYGGEAGGGKTDLLVGLSLTKHKRSLVLRRTNKEASKLVERYMEVLGSRDGWNGQDDFWRVDGRVIDIGGCQHEDDKQKYKGTPHDFIGFDEVADFSESQFRFIIGWNRSTDPEQRCRVVAAGNPPTTAEGLWVIQYWAPWLDENHPNPAKPGEMRWFTTIGGRDTEVDGPGPHLVGGEPIIARSRTFIRAKLSDNRELERTGYGSVLAALPAELRAAYKEGRFGASMKDDEWQVIPTNYILDSQKRWTVRGRQPADIPMTVIAVDVAQGGADQTVLAPRHDYWYAPLVVVPGSETPLPSDVAAFLTKKRRDGAAIVVDVGGGYGGGVVDILKQNDIGTIPFNGANQGVGRTKDRTLGFANKRAEAWWKFREALDPDQPGGSPIELPDDPALRADLTAPRWKLTTRGILIESKEEIKKRIGRSPDRGDAVVMAWSEGNAAIRRGLVGARGAARGERPKFATVGYASAKRRRMGVEAQSRR